MTGRVPQMHWRGQLFPPLFNPPRRISSLPLLSFYCHYRVICSSPQVSSAMGFGFRCGFLGLLHMEIVQERLEREYDLDLIITAPTVVYKAMLTDGEEVTVDNPCLLPEAARREYISEPYVRSAVFSLCSSACRTVSSDVMSLVFCGERVLEQALDRCCCCVPLHWLPYSKCCSWHHSCFRCVR